jgi:tetratricopeptide (TPR) repeat protein
MSPRLPMDLARWRRIEAVLDLAWDFPPEARGALLDQACDPDVRAEVEALLAADAQAGGFLGVPAGEASPELLVEAGEDAAEESAADLAGRQVGPYRLLREIGSGGMGTVYEAEDTRLGRRVAVKLLPTEYSRDRRAKERFLREARAASAVDHPNLCTVHDVGESEGRLYIVLALYEGETLRERISRGPLPLAEAREVAIQVTRGLVRAHEAGIVHRDIKAANVMLTRRGEAKILDFGIARLAGEDTSLTRTGSSWGTPAYMSPEQVRGEPVDHRTDLWSLGVLLYEMIAGRRPFRGESPEALAAAIQNRQPEPLGKVRPDVPLGLARVVERALAKDPARRHADAAGLLADLERAPAEVPAFQRLRRRALRTVLLVGVPAALLLLAFALWRTWRPPLRVAIQRPVIEAAGSNPELAFVSSAVVEAHLATLLSLQGLQPLDPPEKDDPSGSEAERLRAAEADEVLVSRLQCSGNLCQVQLRRLRMPGRTVLARVEGFEVPVGLESSYQLAAGVRGALQRLYRGHKPRRGSPGVVRSDDYADYIEIERRVEAGRLVGREELDRLDQVLQTSPGLVGAYLLAAGISRLCDEPERGLDYARRAESIAPHDPEPIFARLRIEVLQDELDTAEATLARLADLVPADVRVKRGRAELLTARGELEEAWKLRQEVARDRPTWRHVRELASLELSMGAHEMGAQRLRQLLAQHPDNQYLLEDLAELEASSGDLKRAAELYERLVRLQPAVSSLTSLGFVRYLLGDYDAAAKIYRRAVDVAPDHSQARFNLAAALEALGQRREAQDRFRALAQELAAAPLSSDPSLRMLYAQCLARLARRDEALRLADEVLKQRPEDVYLLHRAAQVHAYLGGKIEALYYVELALEKGLRREWFLIPGFGPLQKDSDFLDLLERHQPSAVAR